MITNYKRKGSKLITNIFLSLCLVFMNSFYSYAGNSTQTFTVGSYRVTHSVNLVNSTGYITDNVDAQHLNYQNLPISLRLYGRVYIWSAESNSLVQIDEYDTGISTTFYYYHSLSVTRNYNQPLYRLDSWCWINNSQSLIIVY